MVDDLPFRPLFEGVSSPPSLFFLEEAKKKFWNIEIHIYQIADIYLLFP